MIHRCPSCGSKPHEQDKLHGLGNRVFNDRSTKTEKILACTRCGHEIKGTLPTSSKGK